MSIKKILPVTKNYEWGGTTFIPELIGQRSSSKKVAELWMGAHPSGCSTIIDSKKTIIDEMKENPSAFGGTDFPFLFKVLSIRKSLSIQVHPNAEQAESGWKNEEERRKSVPQELWNYKDKNPKTEIFYALTPITAMCGFRKFEDISEDFSKLIPGTWNRHFSKISDLKAFFHCLYHLDENDLTNSINELKMELSKKAIKRGGCFIDRNALAFDLCNIFTTDPGVFAPYFMNMINANPGECILLPTGIIHAYTYGDGIELMNNSDNVLRAGLTPKHMDVDELEKILISEPFGDCFISPEKTEIGNLFNVPNCFSLLKLNEGESKLEGGKISIVLCIDGSCTVGNINLLKGECCLVDKLEKDIYIKNNGSTFIASTAK